MTNPHTQYPVGPSGLMQVSPGLARRPVVGVFRAVGGPVPSPSPPRFRAVHTDRTTNQQECSCETLYEPNLNATVTQYTLSGNFEKAASLGWAGLRCALRSIARRTHLDRCKSLLAWPASRRRESSGPQGGFSFPFSPDFGQYIPT